MARRLRQSLELSGDEAPAVLLKRLFQQSGYVRVADLKRKKELGRKYRKGYEVRLVVRTQDELAQVRQLLRLIGFKAGNPFPKHSRLVQPIYGKAAVEWFLSKKLVGAKKVRERKLSTSRAESKPGFAPRH